MIDYSPFWVTLEKSELDWYRLVTYHHISSSSLSRLKNGKDISMKTVNDLCRILNDVARLLPDYHAYVENYMRRSYTIGGMIVFPKHNASIKQMRGCNRMICDRMDLTLECIRRFYADIDSPLSATLEKDKNFFDLFVDFKGYIDYFFLQDWVDSNYKPIIFGEWRGMFYDNPLPKTQEEYLPNMRKPSRNPPVSGIMEPWKEADHGRTVHRGTIKQSQPGRTGLLGLFHAGKDSFHGSEVAIDSGTVGRIEA